MRRGLTAILCCMLAAAALSTGCRGNGTASVDAAADACDLREDVQPQGPPPVIKALTVTQSPNCVLSAILDVETDLEVSVVLKIDGPGGTRTIRFVEQGGSLSLPVLGLQAKTAYSLTVTAASKDGAETTSAPVPYTTPALPDGPFPPLSVVTRHDELMQPGITVASSLILQLPLDQRPGLFLAVDPEGNVIWYHTHPNQVLEAFTLTRKGTLLYLAGTDGAREMDMLGRTVQEWNPVGQVPGTKIDVLGLHHDIIELPDDHIAAIGIEMRDVVHQVDGEAVTHHVVGDVILEWTREGELVHAWSAFDFLDPQFYKTDFNDSFWDLYIDVDGGTKNWTHGNGLLYDPSDDSFILSLRYLDWLVKVARDTGKLVWKMGELGDFAIAGEGEWFYHPHAPDLIAPGRIILFDNGNLRPGYTPETFFSRALEFTYDETGMTFSQVWEWRGDQPFYSQYLGDADRLENGNVLVADGGRVQDQAQPMTNPFNLKWFRIVEVTDSGEVAWEMLAQDFSGNVLGYSLFRAQRWPAIYPEAIAEELP